MQSQVLSSTVITATFCILNLSVDGVLDGWGPFFYSGHSDYYTSLCSNESACGKEKCSAPMNGGWPCTEMIEDTLKSKCNLSPPYRCHCEFEIDAICTNHWYFRLC